MKTLNELFLQSGRKPFKATKVKLNQHQYTSDVEILPIGTLAQIMEPASRKDSLKGVIIRPSGEEVRKDFACTDPVWELVK